MSEHGVLSRTREHSWQRISMFGVAAVVAMGLVSGCGSSGGSAAAKPNYLNNLRLLESTVTTQYNSNNDAFDTTTTCIRNGATTAVCNVSYDQNVPIQSGQSTLNVTIAANGQSWISQ